LEDAMTDESLKYTFGPFTFDPDRKVVENAEGDVVFLTRRERDMLLLIAMANGETAFKDVMYRKIYENLGHLAPEPKIIDVKICQIRKKLRVLEPGNADEYIVTVWGRGYRLSQEPVGDSVARHIRREEGELPLQKRFQAAMQDLHAARRASLSRA